MIKNESIPRERNAVQRGEDPGNWNPNNWAARWSALSSMLLWPSCGRLWDRNSTPKKTSVWRRARKEVPVEVLGGNQRVGRETDGGQNVDRGSRRWRRWLKRTSEAGRQEGDKATTATTITTTITEGKARQPKRRLRDQIAPSRFSPLHLNLKVTVKSPPLTRQVT